MTTQDPQPQSLDEAIDLITAATALGAHLPAPKGTSVWVVTIPPFAGPGPDSVFGVYVTYQDALTALTAHALADWVRRDNRQQAWIEPRPWFSSDEHEAFHTAMSAEERLEAIDRFAAAKERWLSHATPVQIVNGWYGTLALSGGNTDHRSWITEHRVDAGSSR